MKTSRIASLAAVLAGLAAAPSLFADCTTPQIFDVTSPNDDGGPGTLRFLVNSASVQDCDTIHIPAMLIVLDGATGQIELKKSITLLGDGAEGTIIDANGSATSDRAFEIDPDDTGVGVTMLGLTIRNGDNTSDGGAILVSNSGALQLINAAIIGNSAVGFGGGIKVDSDGDLTVDNSTISGNVASSSGGGIYMTDGYLLISNGSVISENEATGSDGGGVYVSDGFAEINGTRIEDNKAGGDGGGIYVSDAGLTAQSSDLKGNITDGSGGALYVSSGTSFLDNCNVTGNQAVSSGDGGGIYNGDVMRVSNSTISGNRAEENGGGIYNSYVLAMDVSTVSDNISDTDASGSGNGGGLYNSDEMFLTASVVSGNASNENDGGGIYNSNNMVIDSSVIADNTCVNCSYGGGLYNDGDPTVIRNTTISGNQAKGDDGSDDARGGGIYLNYPINIINSTIVNNSADGDGGGILTDDEPTTLNNVTIAFNTADANSGGLTDGDGGGIHNTDHVTLINTIIAGNTDGSAGAEAPDCYNNFTADADSVVIQGPNLIQNLDGCEVTGDVGSLINDDPLFNAAGLADNGGPDVGDQDSPVAILTLALQDSSLAVDSGNDGTCEATDENGVARPVDGNGDGEAHCDLGAVEAAAISGGSTTGGDTTGGDTTGGSTTGGTSDSGGCSLIR